VKADRDFSRIRGGRLPWRDVRWYFKSAGKRDRTWQK